LLLVLNAVMRLSMFSYCVMAERPAKRFRTVETHKNQSLPPGAVLIARRAQQALSTRVARSSSPSRGAEKPSTFTNATDSSLQKLFKPPPNKANAQTGWGPIENLTVAALDYQQVKPRVPQQDEAFTELAEWIYEHSQQYHRQQQQQQHQEHAADQQGAAADAAGVAGKGVEYYQRLASQLLMLHNSANTNLQQPSPAPQLKTADHCARQLWNSIPQADNMPAVHCKFYLCLKLTSN
jgi:glucan-binding YG repeat protein